MFFDKSLGGCSRNLPSELEKRSVDIYSVNQKGMREYLLAHEPDLIWVYGTGKIYPHIIELPKWGMVNLHGGISQKYRGLDSTLWAIYFNDFMNLGLTAHYVKPELDTGDIIEQKALTVSKKDEFYHFRYKMTLLATEISISLLNKFKNLKNYIPAKAQNPGNYYSAMELDKKKIALNNFLKYKEKI